MSRSPISSPNPYSAGRLPANSIAKMPKGRRVSPTARAHHAFTFRKSRACWGCS
jgi:hypothetical protein